VPGPPATEEHGRGSERMLELESVAKHYSDSGEQVRAVHENESIYIPIGSVHRMANQGKISLELIEVQTGSYLGEDDIERIEDIYKRR